MLRLFSKKYYSFCPLRICLNEANRILTLLINSYLGPFGAFFLFAAGQDRFIDIPENTVFELQHMVLPVLFQFIVLTYDQGGVR